MRRLAIAFALLATLFACAAVVEASTSRFTIQNLNWNFANVSLECSSGRVLKVVWNIPTGSVVRGRVAFRECQSVQAYVTFVGARETIMLDLLGWTPEFQVDITIANSLSFSTYRVR